MTNRLSVLSTILAVFLLLPQQMANAAEKHKARPTPIETAKVIKRSGGEVITLYGNVNAGRAATVAAELDGNITSFKKDVGDWVKKGETVCQIDSSGYELELERLKSRLKSAEAAEEKSNLEMQRATTLFQKGIGSQEVYDGKRLAHKMAMAELAAAKVATKKGKRDLNLTNVRAPYAGKIAGKHMDEGDWASRGKPLFDIVDLSSAYVLVNLPEKELRRVAKGKATTVTLDAYPDKTFKGKVSKISPRANINSRSISTRISINKPNRLALDGLFARVEIPLAGRQTLLVSKDALVVRGPKKLLFKVTGNLVKQVAIKVLGQTGDMLEISGNIKQGDDIAVTGNEILRDGAAVIITPRH